MNSGSEVQNKSDDFLIKVAGKSTRLILDVDNSSLIILHWTLWMMGGRTISQKWVALPAGIHSLPIIVPDNTRCSNMWILRVTWQYEGKPGAFTYRFVTPTISHAIRPNLLRSVVGWSIKISSQRKVSFRNLWNTYLRRTAPKTIELFCLYRTK